MCVEWKTWAYSIQTYTISTTLIRIRAISWLRFNPTSSLRILVKHLRMGRDYDDAEICHLSVSMMVMDERVDDGGQRSFDLDKLDTARAFPSMPKKQDLKRLSEEHGRPNTGHNSHSRFCSGLFVLTMQGMPASEHYKAAENILREWKVLRLSLTNEGAAL